MIKDRASGRPERPAEATEVHTRILRLALGIEESRSYWEHVVPSVPAADRGLVAFEHRWFGSKSLERVRFLLSNFVDRYDAFPEALDVLRRWRSMDAATRQVVCHWHLQLSDPLYRRFTGQFLVERRGLRDPKVDREVVLRWVKNEFPDRWSEATLVQFASKLLSAASEAGVVSAKRDPRALLMPKVPDLALAYLMHLLRGLRFAGTLTENPYLTSVGLAEGVLDQRLRSLRGMTFRRMAHLTEFEWEAPTLTAWAEAAL
ncbi:hypothetical protein SOCE836_098480 [Sorangium cellulosum]|uniref:DUF1819 domain-containing protein n=1 Tax=Sorangium cellulosum TaxID=56 RepID=A0A4P2R4E9_SORCE|nr:hypothetical protein SOCE836_098480 [Sorangium cellulosum]WCQ96908.1 hypothetical protein NQZ70_09698 [Sorangium sp. Soce836]